MPDLRPSDVVVRYRITDSIDPEALTRAATTLSADERERRNRLRFDEDRRDYTIAHDLLRRSLSQYEIRHPSSWEFGASACGKPVLVNVPADQRPLSFSLSHARGLVACALAAGMPVGIDVERIGGAQTTAIAERFFSPSEVVALRACPEDVRPVRFIELWTLKEAFLKAVGVGLSRSLSSMSFAFGEDASIDLTTADAAEAHGFQFALFEPVPGTRLAVAARTEGRAVGVVHAADFDRDHAIPALLTSSSWRGSRTK